MPACLSLSSSLRHYPQQGTVGFTNPPAKSNRQDSVTCLNVGLINNMPDGALETTERQFLSLLQAASGRMDVHLSLFSLPGVPRNGVAARRISGAYRSVEHLWNTSLDGLIVTGREPLAQDLANEPYWASFTEVVEWAKSNTYSTVWSCLAAHAAIQSVDGIRRVRSHKKHCGVFECIRVTDHVLTSGAPSQFVLPHSRWNGVSEEALTRSGYQVLTRTADAGVDMFIKENGSLFVFFQGHPEYDSDTLLNEYRRDVGRYLRGDVSAYPSIPSNYFDQGSVEVLDALQRDAISQSNIDLFPTLSSAITTMRTEATWRTTATCIYRNWLRYIWTQKELRIKNGPAEYREQQIGRPHARITAAV